MKLFNAICLGLAASAIASAPAEDPEDNLDEDMDEPAAAEEAKGPTDVFQLTKENIDSTLKETPFVFVKFYAPWCGHCKQMAPDWEKLAVDYKESKEVKIAELDATVHEEGAQKHGVSGYPTIKWFAHGNEGQMYNGKRTYDALKEYVAEAMKPALKEVAALSELDEPLAKRKELCPRPSGEDASGNAAVMCVDKAIIIVQGDAEAKKVAEKLAEKMKPNLATTYYVAGSENTVTMYKGTVEKLSTPVTTADEVSKWAADNRVPTFGQINEENFEIYLEHAKAGMLWVCLDPATLKEDLDKYSTELSQVKSEYPFVWFDINDFEAHAKSELGCKEFPTVVLQKGDLLSESEDAQIDKFIKSFKDATLSKEGVEQFLAGVGDGSIKPEPIPDELDQMDDEDEGQEGEEGEEGEDGEDMGDMPDGEDEEL